MLNSVSPFLRCKSVASALSVTSVTLVVLIARLASAQAPAPPTPTPASQPPPRETSPSRPLQATSTISGQITAAANDQPLHRVKVTLAGSTPNPLTAITNDRGEYEVTGVPPGSYSLTAARAGYLTIQYGQRRPREAGRRIEVRAGQDLRRVDIALSRGAVLSGRIADEMGEPYPGVRVEAMEPRYVSGRRTAVPAGIDTTDDIGEFRISGLNPGTYTLRASTIETWEAEGGQRTTYAYSITYYPGATASDRAESIVLAVGQEVANLDFALSVGRTALVSGRVENANGEPVPGLPVGLSRITRTIGGALLSSGPGGSGRTGSDGSFEIRNMPPGEYLLTATFSATESAAQTVFLAEADVTNMVLRPGRQSAVSGTVVTEDGTPPSFPAARLQVAPILAGDAAGLQLWEGESPQAVRGDWSFAFMGMRGRFLFRVNGLPDDWMLRSVTLNGRDITDTGLETPADGSPLTGLRLVLSEKGASVTGVVLDAHGAPLPDSSVMVFAEDSSLWTPGSRFVKSGRPDLEGRFTVAGLPAGTYLVAPKDFVAEGEWEDPAFLRSIVPLATKVTLPEGTTQELSLTVDLH
jgi:protocatechuate 3,4-dioxygenase beta subunit